MSILSQIGSNIKGRQISPLQMEIRPPMCLRGLQLPEQNRMLMKALHIVLAGTALALSGCEGWPASPIQYVTPVASPSRTPSIRTPTPFILTPASTAPPTETAIISSPPATATMTEITSTAVGSTPTRPASSPAPYLSVLGCDTSLDLAHGMGEVTNAYLTVNNFAATDLADVCVTLRGLDEGRPHPDKTKCVPSIPAGYQVTLKLTVDTTYGKDTPIQIDVTSGGALLVRAGEASCTDIGLLPPGIRDLGVIKPIRLP